MSAEKRTLTRGSSMSAIRVKQHRSGQRSRPKMTTPNGHRPSHLRCHAADSRTRSIHGWHARIACCVPLAGLRGPQNSSSDDLAVHFQLAYILKGLAGQIVCLVHSDHVSWIEGQISERRIYVGHDVPCEGRRCKRWVAAKSPANDQGNFALTLRGSVSSGCRSHLCKKAAEWFVSLPGKIAI